jgi:hypothetical protein
MATLDQELVSYLRDEPQYMRQNEPLSDIEFSPDLLANKIETHLDDEGNFPSFATVPHWEDNFVEELMTSTNNLQSLTPFVRLCLIEMDVILIASDHGHHECGVSCDDFIFFLRCDDGIFHETGRAVERISFEGLGSGEVALKKPTAAEVTLIKEMAINASALEEL